MQLSWLIIESSQPRHNAVDDIIRYTPTSQETHAAYIRSDGSRSKCYFDVISMPLTPLHQSAHSHDTSLSEKHVSELAELLSSPAKCQRSVREKAYTQ